MKLLMIFVNLNDCLRQSALQLSQAALDANHQKFIHAHQQNPQRQQTWHTFRTFVHLNTHTLLHLHSPTHNGAIAKQTHTHTAPLVKVIVQLQLGFALAFHFC